MGYIKEKILESINKETEIKIQKYKSGLSDEEQKKLSDMIDCQIEDIKLKRDEEKNER